MGSEKQEHDLIVDHLKKRFSGQYGEIRVNEGGLPDLVLVNHGLILAFVEVETSKTITSEKAERWKEMAQSGSKLILMVPKAAKVKVMELLWKYGIADTVGVGTYEITVQMP